MNAHNRSAIVHDWVIDLAGAEKCLASIYRIFPSDLYSLLTRPQTLERLQIPPETVQTSFISRMPQAEKRYRSYLPLFPTAVESFDLSDYELVLSSSHSVAKGVLTHAAQLHICYCYTPMRYAWDLYHQYLRDAGLDHGLQGIAARAMLHYLRLWDQSSVSRVRHFIAISEYIARRIRHVYGRESTVIYPPVDVNGFDIGPQRDDFYLAASRLVPYKRMDLIVDAFARMPDRHLVLVGDGPEICNLRRRLPRNVQMLGYQPDDVLRDFMQRARAFIFAAEEDFGIVPVEAQACGTPVIAYARGGSQETVIEGVTGHLFEEQSVESLVDATRRFENGPTLAPPYEIRRNALRFSVDRFEREMKSFVLGSLEAFRREQRGQGARIRC